MNIDLILIILLWCNFAYMFFLLTETKIESFSKKFIFSNLLNFILVILSIIF